MPFTFGKGLTNKTYVCTHVGITTWLLILNNSFRLSFYSISNNKYKLRELWLLSQWFGYFTILSKTLLFCLNYAVRYLNTLLYIFEFYHDAYRLLWLWASWSFVIQLSIIILLHMIILPIPLQNWTDQFLQWDPSSYNDTYHMVFFAENVWLPDTAIINR